jgi:prepilin-type N-terminal cleavage/methylation domain-containing protein
MMTNLVARSAALGNVDLLMITTPSLVTRRGFSLVELLVVLAIIATMAGLVLSGLFTTRDTNRLLAAEQMLAGAIRQARHTARSSGSPVELRLTPTFSGTEVIGAKLGGVSRLCLWSETFDKERDMDDDGVIDGLDASFTLPEPVIGAVVANGVVVGRSGNGWQPSIDFPNFPPSPSPPPQLTRGSALVRGTRSDGFYLACSVLLPAKPNRTIPLLLIGKNDTSPSAYQCLLALQARTVIVHGTDLVPVATVVVWDLVGEIQNKSGKIGINSALDAIADHMGVEKLPSGKSDIPRPIVGGRWIDVGLLYDGERMILYCDGERIAQRPVGPNSQLVEMNSSIYLGSMPNDYAATPPTIYANVPLDDARLYRLGTADLGELPGNVVLISNEVAKPDLGYRILCQPDGRVEVSRDNDPNKAPINDRVTNFTTGPRVGDSATITLAQLRTPSALQAAEITVMLDGRVTSRLLTHAQAVVPK